MRARLPACLPSQGIFIIWGCFLMCIAWFVGISRFVDNRHNIDDILVRGGADTRSDSRVHACMRERVCERIGA